MHDRSPHWLFDAIHDGVVLLDAEWRLTFLNRTAEHLLGTRQEEVEGKIVGREIPAPPNDQMRVYREVMRERRMQALPGVRLERPGLEERIFDGEVHPAPDGGIAIVFRDVTHRVLSEVSVHERAEEADRMRREAETANQAKSQFLATMSHEIRTPINAIVGYTDLLEMGIAGPLTEGQRAQLDRIKASSEHLLGLVDEILDLAKVESGQFRMERVAAALQTAVASALGLTAPQASSRGLRITEPPECDPDLAYLGDEERVRQILANLLSNAVKFTEPGGEIAVTCGSDEQGPPDVEASNADGWVRVEVRDSGIGISPGETEAVFEPFVQVESGYTRTGSGTGLGLTISRRLARQMGGDLTVQSQPGEGSRFTLWLPRAPKGAQPPAQPIWGDATRPFHGLAPVGRLVADRAESIVAAYCDRMRADPEIPRAHEVDRPQLEDHMPTLLVDVGLALVALDQGGGEPQLLQDGSEIQQLISEKHGAQRARLGWTEESLRRELVILHEEVEEMVRRHAPAEPEIDVDAALSVLLRLLEHSQRISLRGFRTERETEPGAV